MHLVLSPPEGAPTETITGRGIVDQSTTTSPAGVTKNPTPKLTTAPVTPQHAQQLNPSMKRARTPEEAGTLLEHSASHPLLNTPPRGMNVTAVEFGGCPPAFTWDAMGCWQHRVPAAQPGLPARTTALPGSAWPSYYSDPAAPAQPPHPAPPGAPPMQQATEQHATLTATQHTSAMYFTPGTLPGAQGHAGAPPGMYFPCLGTPPPPPVMPQKMMPPVTQHAPAMHLPPSRLPGGALFPPAAQGGSPHVSPPPPLSSCRRT